MATTTTTMAAAVHLPLPQLEPVAVEGCDVCRALGKQRAEARTAGNMSRVSDCNVEIRAHSDHHGGRP
ncbi:hypothetical protein [Streptomyces sp. NPDC088794]|uniref:hypothetical protein n=1 Tax=Streptomyces sp. NPDC088794 TaxID=3365902 RepID=UPI0037FA9457